MASLIITIIGIALVAVVAIMGAYYGGTAFGDSQAQANANSLLNEVHQIYAAATEYGLDHGLSNFGTDFSITSVESSHTYLQEIPTIAGQAAYAYSDADANNGSDANCNNSISVGTLDGEPVIMARGIYQSNGTNVVGVFFLDLTGGSVLGCEAVSAWGSSLSAASSANLPVVKMALAINKTMGLPSGLTFADSGLPYALDGSAAYGVIKPGGSGSPWSGLYFNGTNKFNYCYLDATSGNVQYGGRGITCAFTN
jgi:hypothetical protein